MTVAVTGPIGALADRHAIEDLLAEEWDVVNLFAGPGGWSEGIKDLVDKELGNEWDEAAAATARAAGHPRLVADVAKLNPLDFHLTRKGGLLASPPCQGFSNLGQGKSREDAQFLLTALARLVSKATVADVDAEIAGLHESMTDDRSILALQPLRWLLALMPAWTVWEQVPNVQPIWDACKPILEAVGYSVDTGVRSAEQYGVPQTRRRAYLIARRADLTAELGPAQLPAPTHSRFYPRTPDKLDPGLPAPVTMGDALRRAQRERYARGAIDTPFYTPTFNDQSGTPFDERWIDKRPATAVAGRGLVQNPGANANRFNGSTKSRNDGVKIDPWMAGVLQSFREDYPWSGNLTDQYRQAGDVVCPLVAHALVHAASIWRTSPASATAVHPGPDVVYGEQGALDLEGIA